MTELTFRIQGRSESAARTRVQARGFTLVLDEPPDLGGTDQGPNPVEYLLAALAGCINVVGHMVAKELGFELRGLEVDAEGRLDPARLLRGSEDTRAGFQEIGVRVRVDADADDETLAAWLSRVEARCPVSDNLGQGTPLRLGFERCPRGSGA